MEVELCIVEDQVKIDCCRGLPELDEVFFSGLLGVAYILSSTVVRGSMSQSSHGVTPFDRVGPGC